LFTGIPKTGGTSLEVALAMNRCADTALRDYYKKLAKASRYSGAFGIGTAHLSAVELRQLNNLAHASNFGASRLPGPTPTRGNRRSGERSLLKLGTEEEAFMRLFSTGSFASFARGLAGSSLMMHTHFWPQSK